MSRWAPAIQSLSPDSEGGIVVRWGLDEAFSAPEEPDSVLVRTPHDISAQLPGSQRSFTIPAKVVELYAGGYLNGQVSFLWEDFPAQELTSAFTCFIPGRAPIEGSPLRHPTPPTIAIVQRTAQTLTAPNSITLHWSSQNVNRGRITWGPAGDPAQHMHTFKQKKDDDQGTFTTTHPLRGRTAYHFLVRVENSFEGTFAESALSVTSADNHHSLRAFLAASGVATPTGLRQHLPYGAGLRAVMGG